MNEENSEGTGGVNLIVRSGRPDDKICGVVAIVHGFNSPNGQYVWVAEQFVASGLAVYALGGSGDSLSKTG